MPRPLASLTIVAVLAIATAANAQPAPNPEAVRHFLEGKRLRDADRCRDAIVELEASVEKEKSIGAYYNLGYCHDKVGQKREAFLDYGEALRLAKERNDDRERELRTQLVEFMEKTPHLRLALPQPTPPDLRIVVDGDTVPTADIRPETMYFVKGNQPSYVVVATASGYAETRMNVSESAVKSQELVQVVLHKPESAAPPTTFERPQESSGLRWQYPVGIGALVVGAVGVTYALVSVVSYASEESELRHDYLDVFHATRGCDQTTPSCQARRAQRDRLRLDYDSNERSATDKQFLWLGAGIGGVLLLGGGAALLLLTHPRKTTESSADASRGRERPSRPTATTSRAASFHIVPTINAQRQGLSIVGTF